MQAILVNYTPNPELTIVAAARSSASQSTIEELWNKLSSHQVDNLLEQHLDSGHLSSSEHVVTPQIISQRADFPCTET